LWDRSVLPRSASFEQPIEGRLGDVLYDPAARHVQTLRRLALQIAQFAKAQRQTLPEKPLKIGAGLRVTARAAGAPLFAPA